MISNKRFNEYLNLLILLILSRWLLSFCGEKYLIIDLDKCYKIQLKKVQGTAQGPKKQHDLSITKERSTQ